MRVAAATPWAEGVLHVLAHVDVGAVAASCHCPAWIGAARDLFGPAEERALAEDAAALARAAGTHDRLARAHAVIGLFHTEAEARDVAARDLAELDDVDVRSPRALRMARDAGVAAEVLRAAAELEVPLLAALPPVASEIETLTPALARVTEAAPLLADHLIAIARPLGERGRLIEGTIYVGAPGIAAAEAGRIAWQAAHEATVAEVIARGDIVTYAEIERRALALLRSRAHRIGLADDHARWFARLDLSALGPIPDVADRT